MKDLDQIEKSLDEIEAIIVMCMCADDTCGSLQKEESILMEIAHDKLKGVKEIIGKI